MALLPISERYKEHIGKAEPGSLNLSDPGCFTVRHLRDFADKGAYFLCRLLPGTGLSENGGAEADLPDLLRSEIRDCFGPELCPGQIMPGCRVCRFGVPEETANLRRRNAGKKAAEKGRTPEKEPPELMNRSVFITNVPVPMLSTGHIALLYPLRWQTELIFRLWKSHMAIHIISGFPKERILTGLYAKLTGLLLFQSVTMPLRNKTVDLSPAKAFKQFIRKTGPSAGSLRFL